MTKPDSGQPYIVVSADAHAGPSLEKQLRPYCPTRYLDDFDAYAQTAKAAREEVSRTPGLARRGVAFQHDPGIPDAAKARYALTKACQGQQDADARIRDMDADGIAAEVIFAGGQNEEEMPFVGFGVDAGPAGLASELRAVGGHIWNAWLADFIAPQCHRQIGVMQVPIWDVDAAVEEVKWGYDHGLRAVNLPAPRADYPAYSELVYEPLWAACTERRLPLVTHSGGGEPPLGFPGRAGQALFWAEVHWLSRRGLWQLIFGGVFERYPELKLVFTEQRSAWVPETLRDLDSIYFSDMRSDIATSLPKPPSAYWLTNCFLSGSFLAPFEADQRDLLGPRNLMWGSDYPHVEGTWPHTSVAMRNTFADVPEADARRILGENALEVYDLDVAALRQIADRIGPTPAELARGVTDDELPAFRGYAYRTVGNFA